MAKEIFFSKPITPETITELITQIGEEKEVIIFLSSNGGNPSSAVAFYNYIKSRGINLTVNVVSECESAAIIILCAANRRIGSKFSTYLLHLLRRTYDGKFSFTVKDLEKESNDLEFGEKILKKIVKKVLGKPLKVLIPLYEKEHSLSAKKAYKLGLLTEKPY